MRGRPRSLGLPLSLRLAFREIRGGLGGFRLFLACLALGVGAIAIVGSLSSALVAGRVRDARAHLGGDIEITSKQRPPSGDERAWLERQGRLSAVVAVDAMASSTGGRILVEIKAVDRAYPLIGTVELDPPATLASVLAFESGAWGIAVPVELMSRLALTRGDVIRIGEVGYRLRAVIRREPDPWGSIWAPHVMVAEGAWPQPDSFVPAARNPISIGWCSRRALRPRISKWRSRRPSLPLRLASRAMTTPRPG